eukprot:11663374-Alexandrium_andersonii.AAC.1
MLGGISTTPAPRLFSTKWHTWQKIARAGLTGKTSHVRLPRRLSASLVSASLFPTKVFTRS